MRFQDETVESPATGLKIFRRKLSPSPAKDRQRAVLMLHGLGDHQGCHIDPAERFVKHGFTAFGFDWPGNGESEGIRGDMAGVRAGCDLIDEALEWIRNDGKYDDIGLYAHSTGGFIGLRYFGLRESNPFSWIWLSAPLINPRFEKPKWLQKIAPIAGEYFPKFTVSTGVSLEKCRHIDPSNPNPGTHQIEGRHRRVSLRFGASLLNHADSVDEAVPVLRDPTTLLITQGDEDQVCPKDFSKPLFEKLDLTNKSYALLHGLRHEPFREPANLEFLKVVEGWISDL